jgi:predicted AlkP superfamily phosphohydrolase/phosphomutase
MNPGKHGVFDFIRPHGTTFDMVNSTSIRQPTLWQRLDAAGLRVGVMNVPVTYPPKPLKNGWMITGLLSPRAAKICTPDDLIRRYEKEIGPYRISPNVQYTQGREDEFIDDLMDLVETRGRWTVHLMQHEPWDVMMTVYGSTDIGSHALWRFYDPTHPQHPANAPEHHKTALRDLYARVDEQIGKMLAVLPDDTAVLVMSDHGFGPLHYSVNLNLMLMKAGLMKLKRTPLTRLKTWLFWRGITPKSVYQLLEKLGVNNLAMRVSKKQRNAVVGKFLSYEDVDWENTKAFSMGHVGQIYVNTEGRHPQGSVEPGMEEVEVREQIVQALYELRHPQTGQPIVSRIIRKEEEFSGPFALNAPDIQVVLDDYNMISFPLFGAAAELFTGQIRGDSGCHRSEGVFIASGPVIRQHITDPAAHITDVAPTVLYLLGMPIPAEIDGKALTDIMETPHELTIAEADEQALSAETGLTAAQTAEIEERLRSLGYLE